MKNALPENASIAKEAKECMQECVSEFISFIKSEGAYTVTTHNLQYERSLSLSWFSSREISGGESRSNKR